MNFIEAVFVASAYSWGCGATNLTKMETWPVPEFTVAVDPAIIPLGTVLQIDAPFLRKFPTRYWRAEDTGPAIVGRKIDLMVQSCDHANWWGVREVVVRVVNREILWRR